MTGGLGAVQTAAVDRALVDPSVARESLALVGALERVRREGESREGDSPLTATLVTLTAVSELRSSWPSPGSRLRADAALVGPGPDGGDVDDLVATGAAVAVTRTETDLDDAAALATLPVDRVREAVVGLAEYDTDTAGVDEEMHDA